MKALVLTLISICSFSSFANPNPAAVNCVNYGGKHLVLDSASGKFGACKVGQGVIGSLTLLKEMQGAKSVAVKKFFNAEDFTWPGYGNPAAHYCSQVGGTIKMFESNGSQTGFCKFDDESIINQWTLFNGAKKNKKLANLLK